MRLSPQFVNRLPNIVKQNFIYNRFRWSGRSAAAR